MEIGYRSSQRKRLILLDGPSYDRLRRRFHYYYEFATSAVNFVRLEVASAARKQHGCSTCHFPAVLEFTAFNRKACSFFNFFCCPRCYVLFFGIALTAAGHRRVVAAVKKHYPGIPAEMLEQFPGEQEVKKIKKASDLEAYRGHLEHHWHLPDGFGLEMLGTYTCFTEVIFPSCRSSGLSDADILHFIHDNGAEVRQILDRFLVKYMESSEESEEGGK